MAVQCQENSQQLKIERELLKNWKEHIIIFQNFMYKKHTETNLLIVITFHQKCQLIRKNIHRQFTINIITKDSQKHIEIIHVIQ